MKAFAPNGSQILGTLERLSGRAEITADSFEKEPGGGLAFGWTGETEIFYDDQETVMRSGGIVEGEEAVQRVFLAEDGTEWLEDNILLVDDDMEMRAASGIRVGDMVDLEGDTYADPQLEHGEFASELQTVATVERETPDCVAIGFEGFDVVGFPLDHLLRVKGRE